MMTFLSANIVLLFDSLCAEETPSQECVSLTDWCDKVCMVLAEQKSLSPDSNTYEFYLSCCRAIAQNFRQLVQFVSHNSLETVVCEFLLNCEWLEGQGALLEAVKCLHRSVCKAEPEGEADHDLLLQLLTVTQLLEVNLRRLLRAAGLANVPAMLKDVLAHPLLGETLGSGLVGLLCLLVGPPVSLNLRNLAWHGFLLSVPPSLHSALCALCGVLPQIGGALLRNQAHQLLFCRLGQAEFFDYAMPNDQPLLSLLEALQPIDGAVVDRFSSGSLILALTEDHPRLARCQLCPLLKQTGCLYTQARYYDACCLAVVAIEAVLRVLYCTANDLPERELCALNSVHFTTLDVVLCSPSRLDTVLPAGFIVWLLDLLQMERGPRLRDKLSHGEFNRLDSIDRNWTLALSASLQCLVLFSRESLPLGVFEGPGERALVTRLVDFWLNEYASVCHPACCLARLLDSVETGRRDLSLAVRYLRQLLDEEEPEQNEAHQTADCGHSQLAMAGAVRCNLNSIWRMSSRPIAANWLNYLRGLTVAAECALVSMRQFATSRSCDILRRSGDDKPQQVLRSRQRANLASFVAMATMEGGQFCARFLELASARLASISRHLNSDSDSDYGQAGPAGNKRLRRLRKRLDNWRVNASPERNRWLECSQLFSGPEVSDDLTELMP